MAAIDRQRPALTARHVHRIGVFGSVARGEARADSDVVAAGGLKPDIRETVLREVRHAA